MSKIKQCNTNLRSVREVKRLITPTRHLLTQSMFGLLLLVITVLVSTVLASMAGTVHAEPRSIPGVSTLIKVSFFAPVYRSDQSLQELVRFPVRGARMRVVGSNGSYTIRTNARGRAALKLKPGRYSVSFVEPHYSTEFCHLKDCWGGMLETSGRGSSTSFSVPSISNSVSARYYQELLR